MLPPILRAQDHCNTLVRRLHQCRQKGELLDCSIRVGTVNGCVKHILVHQIIIHCSSNILKELPCDVVTKVVVEIELDYKQNSSREGFVSLTKENIMPFKAPCCYAEFFQCQPFIHLELKFSKCAVKHSG